MRVPAGCGIFKELYKTIKEQTVESCNEEGGTEVQYLNIHRVSS